MSVQAFDIRDDDAPKTRAGLLSALNWRWAAPVAGGGAAVIASATGAAPPAFALGVVAGFVFLAPALRRGSETAVVAPSVTDSLSSVPESVAPRGIDDPDTLFALKDIPEGMKRAIGLAVSDVGQKADKLHGLARSLDAAVDGIASRNADVSERVETTTQEVGAATERAAHLSTSIDEISENVSAAERRATQAAEQAQGVNAQVAGLTEVTGRIEGVIDLIAQVAKQTNLLALNATIEAARAGEAGRGFQVVAGEVKTLATQTAEATSRITEDIAAMRAAVNETVQGLEALSASVMEAGERSTHAAAAVQDQRCVVARIVDSMEETCTAARAVAEEVRAVSDASATVREGSKEVIQTAQGSARTVLTLNRDLGRMLQELDTVVERLTVDGEDAGLAIGDNVVVEAGGKIESCRIAYWRGDELRVDVALEASAGDAVTVRDEAGVQTLGGVLAAIDPDETRITLTRD